MEKPKGLLVFWEKEYDEMTPEEQQIYDLEKQQEEDYKEFLAAQERIEYLETLLKNNNIAYD